MCVFAGGVGTPNAERAQSCPGLPFLLVFSVLPYTSPPTISVAVADRGASRHHSSPRGKLPVRSGSRTGTTVRSPLPVPEGAFLPVLPQRGPRGGRSQQRLAGGHG